MVHGGGRRIRPALIAIAMSAALFALAAVHTAAQDYSLYGDLEVEVLGARTGQPAGEDRADRVDRTISTGTILRAHHLLTYPWGEAVVRHRFRVTGESHIHDGQQILHHYLQQAALVMWPVEALTIQLGRHSLPWGMGAAFFPGDALHPERTRDGEDRGFDGASGTWTFSPDWTIAVAGRVDTAVGSREESPRYPLRHLRWAGLISGFMGTTEVSASVVYQHEAVLRPAVGVSFPAGPVIVHGEAALEVIGTERSTPDGTARGAGVGAADGTSTDGPAAAGARYTIFTGSHAITLALEYLYTEQGPPLGGDPRSGHHFLYPMISWEMDDRWYGDLSALVDVEKRHGQVRLLLSRGFAESLTLGTELVFLVHEETTPDDPRGLVRVFARAHF